MEIALTRIDPARNMARFYTVGLAPSLFGDVAVVRHWGRLGTRGRIRIDLAPDRDAAIAHAARLIGRKIRRGYR